MIQNRSLSPIQLKGRQTFKIKKISYLVLETDVNIEQASVVASEWFVDTMIMDHYREISIHTSVANSAYRIKQHRLKGLILVAAK